jgi:hypothetical protein
MPYRIAIMLMPGNTCSTMKEEDLTMCFADLLRALHDSGLNPTPAQVRWAITTGKVSRPPLDGSLSFDFKEEHLAEIREYLRARQGEGRGSRLRGQICGVVTEE